LAAEVLEVVLLELALAALTYLSASTECSQTKLDESAHCLGRLADDSRHAGIGEDGRA
jgi:hypothetical protein